MGSNNYNYSLFCVVFLVNLMSFLTGGVFTWSSPAIPKLNGSIDPENNPLPEPLKDQEAFLIVALLPFGAAVGSLVFGKVSDLIGRKNNYFIYLTLMTICLLLKAFGKSVYFFYAARIIGGFGAGAGFTTMPIYLGEIAEDRNRGAIGCIMMIFATLGALSAYCIGPYLSVMWFSLVYLIPLVIVCLGLLLFIPESPHYLIYKNQIFEAEKSLQRLRSHFTASDTTKELKAIVENIEKSASMKAKLIDFVRVKSLRKGLTICLGVMIFEQISGFSVMVMNLQTIFQLANTSVSPEISSIAVGLVQLLSSVITPFIVDRAGRKILLLISLLGTFIAQLGMGVYFYLQDRHMGMESLAWFPLLALIMFMFLFNFGLAPVPWVYVGELFPLHMRAKASTLTIFTNLIVSSGTNFLFPYIVEYVGLAISFWVFSFFCLVGLLFTLFYIPETKGKSFTSIQEILGK